MNDLALGPLHEIRYVDVENSREIVRVVTNDIAIDRAPAWLRHPASLTPGVTPTR